jgi:glycine cleavage system H lipoate-binding protein
MIEQVTNGKKPCIWMEAGVVDFKICNHCFDCASCEFDRAMTAVAAQSLYLRDACELTMEQQNRILPLKERMRQRSFEQLLEDQSECFANLERPQVSDVFGFAVPDSLYLHRGHTWAALETCGRVRIGLDDFSQKVLGPADEVRLPKPGQKIKRDKTGLDLVRQGRKAAVLASLDGVVEVVNQRIQQRPRLAHDDPYGEGWLLVITPTNLKRDLEKMLFGRRNAAWIENETHKLLGMLESSAGVTLPSGGAIVDDLYGHYPDLGWERLVREFLLTG